MSGLDLFLSQREPALMFVYATVVGFFLGAVYGTLCLLRLLVHEMVQMCRIKKANGESGCREEMGDMPPPDRVAENDCAHPPDTASSDTALSDAPKRHFVGSRVLLFFTDLIFALVSALALILLLYYTNDGQFRAPAVIGMACGFFVYTVTLGRLILRVGGALVRFACRLVRVVVHAVWTVLCFVVIRLVFKPVCWILRPPFRLMRRLFRATVGKWLRAARAALARWATRWASRDDDATSDTDCTEDSPPV